MHGCLPSHLTFRALHPSQALAMRLRMMDGVCAGESEPADCSAVCAVVLAVAGDATGESLVLETTLRCRSMEA